MAERKDRPIRLQIPEPELGSRIHVQKDQPEEKHLIPLDGEWLPSHEPPMIGKNFTEMTNIRYGHEGHPESVLGMSLLSRAVPFDLMPVPEDAVTIQDAVRIIFFSLMNNLTATDASVIQDIVTVMAASVSDLIPTAGDYYTVQDAVGVMLDSLVSQYVSTARISENASVSLVSNLSNQYVSTATIKDAITMMFDNLMNQYMSTASVGESQIISLTTGGGSFPSAGILDNFDRADADPIGGNWTAVGPFSFQIVSHQLQISSGKSVGISYWNPATFGPNSEAYITVIAVANTDIVTLQICITNPGVSQNDYQLDIVNASSWTINLLVSGSVTASSSTWTQTVSAGDKVGLSNVGGVLTAYYCASGGSWTSIGTWNDATYNTGNIGLSTSGAPVFDDFGGGAA